MQVKEHFDIIIIGAGAAGLMAASELTRVKMKILLLEAQPRIGGRMYTNVPQNFSRYIESGAEFIHGEAPITLDLLKEARIDYTEMSGNVYHANNERDDEDDSFDTAWDSILHHLKKLESDMPMSEFLEKTFEGKKYDSLKADIVKFIEGYNAADATKVSAFALRDEWSEEEDPAQYRIKGGYEKLYDFLKNKIESHHGIIKLNHKVVSVNWQKNKVEVVTDQKIFHCHRCIVTLPVSLLKLQTIQFEPAIPLLKDAAEKMGFGGVIKITMEFHRAFWETDIERKLKAMQFLFTDEAIPTWWSQTPDSIPLLTGWLGGPKAERLSKTDEEILQLAITSLANAMQCSISKIKQELKAYSVDQWVNNEFSMGAYSYEMVGAQGAIKILSTPIEETIFFAGEAIYTGPHKGTVEAALTSGRDVALRIINAKN